MQFHRRNLDPRTCFICPLVQLHQSGHCNHPPSRLRAAAVLGSCCHCLLVHVVSLLHPFASSCLTAPPDLSPTAPKCLWEKGEKTREYRRKSWGRMEAVRWLPEGALPCRSNADEGVPAMGQRGQAQHLPTSRLTDCVQIKHVTFQPACPDVRMPMGRFQCFQSCLFCV